MSDESPTDALLDDVLSHWSVDDPPEDFAARVAAAREDEPMQLPTPAPIPTDRTRPWVLPTLMSLAAAALVWLWLRPAAQSPRPVPVLEAPPLERGDAAPPPADPPGDLAQLEADWAALSRDIEAANQLFPFAAEEEESLDFEEFEVLYGPDGDVIRFGRKLLVSGEHARVHPGVVALLERAKALRSLIYADGQVQFAVDVMFAGGADTKQITLEVDGSVVRYRNGPRSWERLSFGRPTSSTTARLTHETLMSKTEIDTTGPWAFFRLLRLAEDAGPTGYFEGPFVFDMLEDGVDRIVVSLDGEKRDGPAARLRRLLTEPVPVPQQLWVDE